MIMKARGTSIIKVAIGVCLGLAMFAICAPICGMLGTVGVITGVTAVGIAEQEKRQKTHSVQQLQPKPPESKLTGQSQSDEIDETSIDGKPEEPEQTQPRIPDAELAAAPRAADAPTEPVPPPIGSPVPASPSAEYFQALQRVARNCPEELITGVYKDELLTMSTKLAEEGESRRAVLRALRTKVKTDGIVFTLDVQKCVGALATLGEELKTTPHRVD